MLSAHYTYQFVFYTLDSQTYDPFRQGESEFT